MSEDEFNNSNGKSEKDQNDSYQRGKVIIKKEAFRNMITHVLRFALIVRKDMLKG